jgi:hypothetical protein
MQSNIRSDFNIIRLHARKFNPLIGIFLVILALNSYVAVRNIVHGREMWGGFYAALVFTIFVYIYTTAVRIDILPEEIVVTTFFIFKQKIIRSHVTGWAFKAGWQNSSRNTPFFRLEIYTENKATPIIVPIKVFKNEDIQRLTEFLPVITEQVKEPPQT